MRYSVLLWQNETCKFKGLVPYMQKQMIVSLYISLYLLLILFWIFWIISSVNGDKCKSKTNWDTVLSDREVMLSTGFLFFMSFMSSKKGRLNWDGSARGEIWNMENLWVFPAKMKNANSYFKGSSLDFLFMWNILLLLWVWVSMNEAEC